MEDLVPSGLPYRQEAATDAAAGAVRRCPCGFENPARFRFCGQCGARLEETSAPPLPGQEAELRRVAVMFSDLVGSTALAEQLDPEELREVISSYQLAASKEVQRYGGHVAQYLGDGLLIYFGYPDAHEDDAQRAVTAALGIVAAVGRLGDKLEAELGFRLAVRLGVHVGLVVAGEIGEGASRERLALGQTPNLAARLQAEAPPGTVVVSGETQRLLQGLFDFRSLGVKVLKGFSKPVEVYEAVEKTNVLGRFELAVARGLTPLVGRERELALLREQLALVRQGTGRAVLITGEPGIGKSRLVHCLREQAESGCAWVSCRCSAYHSSSSFHPLIELVEGFFGLGRTDTPQQKLDRLERAGNLAGEAMDTVPLLAALLSLPLGDRHPPLELSPQRRMARTFEVLLSILARIAEERPLVFVLEDLHWVDPSTLELLHLLVQRAPSMPVLALLTCRPSFQVPWEAVPHLTSVSMDRLSEEEATGLVDGVIRGRTLPGPLLRQLVEKADGVPLFLEELTKTVLASGLLEEVDGRLRLRGSGSALEIPATLQGSLMARLDQLGRARELAQLAAVVGRRFTWEILASILGWDAVALEVELVRLVRAELLYQEGVPPHAVYTFKHALIQDTAYQSLLQRTRRLYHERVAKALEEKLPGVVETQPEVLAHHLSEAGQAERALEHWMRAGSKDLERGALQEGIEHFQKGLALLEGLPEGADRDRGELGFRMALGAALMLARGFAAPEVKQALVRALELAEDQGQAAGLFQVLFGLWSCETARGNLRYGEELASRLLLAGQSGDDPSLLFLAHYTAALPRLFLGELAAARRQVEDGFALEVRDESRASALTVGVPPSVSARNVLATVLFYQGFPDQAAEQTQEAIESARRIHHSFSLAQAQALSSWVYQLRGDRKEVRQLAGEAVSLSAERGFQLWLAFGLFELGWVAAGESEAREEGLCQMREALEAWCASGCGLYQVYYRLVLAESCLEAGRTAEAERLLKDGFRACRAMDERLQEAELHRLCGEVILAAGRERELRAAEHKAERCFRKALDVAGRQGARSLELRAVLSLGRLWKNQGRQGDASRLLERSYNGFTEGFETRDLKEAHALLEEVS